MPRGQIYDGEHHRISLTSQNESLVSGLVGKDKPFRTLSQLINQALPSAFGSEVQKTEQQNEGLRKSLGSALEGLGALRKKNSFAEMQSRVLSQIYSIPVSSYVELAEKARGDWQEHSGKCSECSHQGSCPGANREGACWQAELDGQPCVAWFKSPDEILSVLLAAVEIEKLQGKVNQLQAEMRVNFSTVKHDGKQDANIVEVRQS